MIETPKTFPWRMEQSGGYATPPAPPSFPAKPKGKLRLPARRGWVAAGALSLTILALFAQDAWLNLHADYPEETLPLPSARRAQIILRPAPAHDWALERPAPVLPHEPSPKPPERAASPLTVTPLPLVNPPPLKPPEPVFSLVGVADGAEDKVATLAVFLSAFADGAGEREMKDVREGDALPGGYVVFRIEPERVTLKKTRGGQILRVD